VSWGKIDPDQLPGTVICYCDTTIALPLLAHYALARHAPRARKRLYHRREELMQALRVAYASEGRAAQADSQR
jgi:deoxyhypusine synthase